MMADLLCSFCSSEVLILDDLGHLIEEAFLHLIEEDLYVTAFWLELFQTLLLHGPLGWPKAPTVTQNHSILSAPKKLTPTCLPLGSTDT